MLEKRGKPPRRLVRLDLEAPVDVQSPVMREGKTVGKVTTVVELPEAHRALAMLKTKQSDEGTAVAVGRSGRRRQRDGAVATRRRRHAAKASSATQPP